MPLSRSPILPYLSTLFSAIFLLFGLTYILRPRTGFSLFGFRASPTSAAEWALMEHIMVLYGAKDVFIGVAIFASTWCGTRRCAGAVLVAAAVCAGVDGWVVGRESGTGEWNHWGYGGVMGGLGMVMAGVVG